MQQAIGAAFDVLTPIGRQCNTLAPGAYRFGFTALFWPLNPA